MNTLLLLDLETNGMDPAKHQVIELGMVLWSVKYRCVIHACSQIAHAPHNDAVAVNGIPADLLLLQEAPERTRATVQAWSGQADAIVAHNASFDMRWLPGLEKPWICSMDDIEWPRPCGSKSLIAMALSLGVGVVAAHRALDDCMTLARMFDRAAELTDLNVMLERAAKPRAVFEACTSYDQNALVKAAGFRWDAENKKWKRRMAVDETANLGFKVKQLEGAA